VATRWLTLGLLALAVTGSCGTPEQQQGAGVAVEAYSSAGRDTGWLALPARPDSIKFAVIGDSGRGSPPQYEVAAQMRSYRERFPFTFVLMNGDNIYEGPASREDYRAKFERPYQALLAEGVTFHAVLGNHDDPRERDYPLFNMGGERYYTFKPDSGVLSTITTDARFFALDSTSLDGTQRAWLEKQLSTSKERWKICFLHHPLYTSGRYGLNARWMRWQLEQLFVDHGVDVVFAGHEHIYQRIAPQNGILYFVSGGAGAALRHGDARPAEFVAQSLDSDFHFMLVEIVGDTLYFQTITRRGRTVDAGVVRHPS
jgi:predicted phosphodiesterase